MTGRQWPARRLVRTVPHMRQAPLLAFVLVSFSVGCSAATRGHGTGASGDAAPASADAAPACSGPPTPAGSGVQLAAPFDADYTAYDLGPVPGVPDPLGGTAILASDSSTLLVAGASEGSDGAVYRIGVTRNSCGHIVGWNGTASVYATTPYVDANLAYVSSDLLLYTEWPEFTVSQLLAGSTAPDRSTDLRTIGMTNDGSDQGPGGLGIVPSGLPDAQQVRLVTWPEGRWYHATTSPDGTLVAVTAVTQTVTLPNNPGGFAYVPAGSPDFTSQAVIVAEWSEEDPTLDRVAVYDVDDSGDPVVASRREFFSEFPQPWGAYFEPVTGDYLFLSWGTGNDHVYLVQGFVPPPPIQ